MHHSLRKKKVKNRGEFNRKKKNSKSGWKLCTLGGIALCKNHTQGTHSERAKKEMSAKKKICQKILLENKRKGNKKAF